MTATAKSKINVGTWLTLMFLITTATGIMLHLKKHGIVVEPRPVIKTIHWLTGYAMTALACWHYIQFKKVFSAMKHRLRLFRGATMAVIFLVAALFLTGAVKQFSPVRIPHLGLWHYWLGLIIIVPVALHLVRGIPAWLRLRKAR